MNDGPINFIISLHVDLLNSLGVDAFKVASTDMNNHQILKIRTLQNGRLLKNSWIEIFMKNYTKHIQNLMILGVKWILMIE